MRDPIVADLHHARRALGWSQHHLAEQAGVTHATVCRLEAGGRTGNIATLRLMAAAMGLGIALVGTVRDRPATEVVFGKTAGVAPQWP